MLARLCSAARPAALLAVAALALFAIASPAVADAASQRALVAFLPAPAQLAPDRAGDPAPGFDWALAAIASEPRLSIGVSSAVQGVYDREQAYLDIGQGTRVSLSAYEPKVPPPLALMGASGGEGRLAGWAAVSERARSAPAELHPGLLASVVPGGAGYAGIVGRPQAPSVVAADRTGRIAELSLGAQATLVARTRGLLTRRALVVVALPPGDAGRVALGRLVAARGADELLLVVQAPPPGTDAQLLPAGALGVPGVQGGRLTSATTHLDGVIAGIDVVPTVLDRLDLKTPSTVKGQPVESVSGRDAAGLGTLVERLRVVLPRRLPALWTLLATWVALLLAAMLVGDRRGQRWAMRVGGLAVLWLPSVLLATAALRPGKTAELLLVTLASLAAGAITDRLVAWPRGPLVPALVGLVAYAVDLAAGSPLVIRSLLGPNPLYGARFYGIGNELEATLTGLLLVGVGVLLAGRGRSRAAVAAFAGSGLVLAMIVGAGRLGADVGGVITIGAGAAVAALLMAPGGLTGRAVLFAVLAPVALLALLAAVDLATGGDSHFTRTVLRADGPGAFWDVVARRYELAGRQAVRGFMPGATLIAVLAIAFAARRRVSLLAPVGGDPAWTALLCGLVAAGVAGALFNDSGPVLLLFLTFLAASCLLYVRGGCSLADAGHQGR